MIPEDITDAVRSTGGCGVISPDGQLVCVQLDGHPDKHPWEEGDDGAGA